MGKVKILLSRLFHSVGTWWAYESVYGFLLTSVSASWMTKTYNSELESWGFGENLSLENYKVFPAAEECMGLF